MHNAYSWRAMWSGALLGAVGFEILKQVSGLLLRVTQGNPAFQVFGIALILLVWINYFSRIVMYAASWAHTDPLTRVQAARDGVPAIVASPVEAAAQGRSGPARLDPRLWRVGFRWPAPGPR